MSFQSFSSIVAAALIALIANTAPAQFHFQSYQNSNYSGSNYARQSNGYAAPIWTIYTPASAFPCMNRVRRMPMPQSTMKIVGRVPTIQNAPTIQGYQFAPTQNHSIAVNPIQMRDLNAASLIVDSIELMEIPTISGEIQPDQAALDSRADSFDSPSDIVLTEQASAFESLPTVQSEKANALLAEQQSRISDLKTRVAELKSQNKNYQLKMASLQEATSENVAGQNSPKKQIEKMNNVVAQHVAQMKEYKRQMADMKKALAEKVQAAASANQKDDTEKRLKAEMKKAKQAAAWEVAKARKDAEKAKAESDRLRKSLESTKAKLIKSARQKSDEKNKGRSQKEADKTDAKKNAKNKKVEEKQSKKTLAQQAEEKRKGRNNETKKSPEKARREKKEKSADRNSQMKNQLQRSTEKIRRRFEAKIGRLENEGGHKDEIEKLKKEMRVQMKKMEERILARFKNRK